MSEQPTSMKTEEDRWAAAVDHAVADKAVGVYFSLDRLLSQLPVTIRQQVRVEIDALGPPPPHAWYCFAHVRADDLPVGTWRTWQRPDRRDVFWFLVAVSHVDYEAVIHHIAEMLTTQRDRSPYN